MSRYATYISLLLCVLASCSQPVTQSSCEPAVAAGESVPIKPRNPSLPVTFYGDLLPILASNAKPRIYKCTTCHAHYNQPSGLGNVPEIERIVKSLETKYMPRGGDPVPAAEIELFTLWRLQGFKERPDVKPSSQNSLSLAQDSACY